jgi:protein-disulfide isomerase
MTSYRTRCAFLVASCLTLAFAGADASRAGEAKGEWTRADLLAALERGPGPRKGSEDAPVTMVYFTDFQCGYCRTFATETLPKLETHYIRPGKVRLVFRHLAILGEASVQAARASSCAFDQGKFWEYHDALFAGTSPLAFNATRLRRHASELRLDDKAFAACLDSNDHGKRVEAETLIGRALGATGTPAFLINGQLALGAYPFDVFQRALDGMLVPPSSKPSASPPK